MIPGQCFKYFTKAEWAILKSIGLVVHIVDDPRYKRKKIVFSTPSEPAECRWVLWKKACVKGGKVVRLGLGEDHPGAWWALVHQSGGGGGWHQQGVRGGLAECVAYAIRHDYLYLNYGRLRRAEDAEGFQIAEEWERIHE